MSTAVSEEQIEKLVAESLETFGADPDQITREATLRGARHRLAGPGRALADRAGALRRRAEGLRRGGGQDGRGRHQADRGRACRAWRRCVVTGVGAVTPLGVGARALHERWSAGACGDRATARPPARSSTRRTSCRSRRRGAPTASRSSRSARARRRSPTRAWAEELPYDGRARGLRARHRDRRHRDARGRPGHAARTRPRVRLPAGGAADDEQRRSGRAVDAPRPARPLAWRSAPPAPPARTRSAARCACCRAVKRTRRGGRLGGGARRRSRGPRSPRWTRSPRAVSRGPSTRAATAS